MTIDETRTLVRANGRNTDATYGDPKITAARVDSAIQYVCNDFIIHTRCLKQINTKALVADTATFSITSPATLRPDRVILVMLGQVTTGVPIESQPDPLIRVSWDELWKMRAEDTATGYPTHYAFSEWAQDSSPNVEGAVWPTPDAAYILQITHVPPFTAWALGAGTGSTVVNLSDDILMALCSHGIPARLQFTDPDQKHWVKELWTNYLEFRERQKGAYGSIVGDVSFKDMMR